LFCATVLPERFGLILSRSLSINTLACCMSFLVGYGTSNRPLPVGFRPLDC